MPPPKTRKPREVAVGRYPLASRLDRKRREPGVRNEVPSHSALPAEPGEDLPAPRDRHDPEGVRAIPDVVDERQRAFERRRLAKDVGVLDDAQEPLRTGSETP